MTRQRSFFIHAALCLVAFNAVAPRVTMAAEAGLFAAIDRNRDGHLEAPELAAYAGALFEQMDFNHDGWVGVADLRAAGHRPAKNAAPTFVQAVPAYLKSAAASGRITQAQYVAGSSARALQQAMHDPKFAAKAAGKRAKNRPVTVPRPVLAAYEQRALVEFQALDKNHDGVITEGEYLTPTAVQRPLPQLVSVLPPWAASAVAADAISLQAWEQAYLIHWQTMTGQRELRIDANTFQAVMARGG